MTGPDTTRILLADDHALVRSGLRMILDAEPDLTVVAEAANGAEALQLLDRTSVDLAILDIAMPRMTGLQAAREIHRRHPHVRILMLSMYDNEQYFFESLKVGACGYVLKSVADRELLQACRATMRGEPFLYPGAITALIRDYLQRAHNGDPLPDTILTPAKKRSSNSSPRAAPAARSPASSSSAPRPSTATAPTSCTSSASATASPSPAMQSALGSPNLSRHSARNVAADNAAYPIRADSHRQSGTVGRLMVGHLRRRPRIAPQRFTG